MKNNYPKVVIFDFDNTLVDTSRFIVKHLYHTCERLNLTPPSEEKIKEILRKNLKFESIFTELFGPEDERVLTAYREDAMQTKYEALPGAIELVKALIENGAKIFIVSNRTNKLEKRLVQARFNPDDFKAIVEPTEGQKKPNIHAYDGALEQIRALGIDLIEVMVVGDHVDDFSACLEGIKKNFVAVLTGPSSRDDFLKVGVNKDKIVNGLNDLREIMFNKEGTIRVYKESQAE